MVIEDGDGEHRAEPAVKLDARETVGALKNAREYGNRT